MGHVHLVVLPKSRKWAAVVYAISGGGTDAAVAALSASAAERDLLDAALDETFVEAVRLSFLVPHAARSADLGDALRQIGLTVGNMPEQFDVIAAVTRRLDEVARGSRLRTDLGQLAGRSLAGVLNNHVSSRLPGLFDPTPADVHAALKDLSTRRGIAAFSRAFFGRIVASSLSSWLSRVLSNEIGQGRRFASIEARSAFDHHLAQYAAEATRIIQEFAPGWFGKRFHEDKTITTKAAAEFGAVAMKKIVSELQLKRDPIV